MIDANVRLSARLDRRINPDHGDLHRAFFAAVKDEMARLPEGSVVADLGGGRHCLYVDHLPADHSLHLVAVDISADELAANRTSRSAVSQTSPKSCRSATARSVSCSLGFFSSTWTACLPRRPTWEGCLPLVESRSTFSRVVSRHSRLSARLLPFGLLLALLHRVSPETRGRSSSKSSTTTAIRALWNEPSTTQDSDGLTCAWSTSRPRTTGRSCPSFSSSPHTNAWSARPTPRSLAAYVMVYAER